MYLAFGITLLKLLQPCHCVHRLGTAKRIGLTSTTGTISWMITSGRPNTSSKMPEAKLHMLQTMQRLQSTSHCDLGSRLCTLAPGMLDSYTKLPKGMITYRSEGRSQMLSLKLHA